MTTSGAWQYTLAECNDQRQFIAQCNAMGVERWELLHVESMHSFLVGFFKRPAQDDAEHDLVHDRTGAGAFDLSPPVDRQPWDQTA